MVMAAGTGIASAQEAPYKTNYSCAALLTMTDEKSGFAMQDPLKNDLLPALVAWDLLTARIGTEALRARVGIVPSTPEAVGKAIFVSVLDAIVLYERHYCVEHPLNTLRDAIGHLAADIGTP